MQAITIKLVPGDIGPRYENTHELKLDHVTITEQGTQAHLPIVDIVATLPNGERAVLVLTGRVLCSIAAAVRGVNLRNHGTEEP